MNSFAGICICSLSFFFFNDTATTEIYPLSLHDALPIAPLEHVFGAGGRPPFGAHVEQDRKSTRLNSSHPSISYAVFCLKKKNKEKLTALTKVNKNKSKLTNDYINIICLKV